MKKKTSTNKLAHKKRNDLLVSFGKISEDDKSWDIKFWQQTSFSERALISLRMAEDVFRLKTGIDPGQMHFCHEYVESGLVSDRSREDR